MEEEELKKEIERIEEIIESFKLDIKRNAENKYDAYTHSNLIKSIENSEYRIKELKAELKGLKAGQLAEREKCLKMIEEVYEDEPVYVQEVEKIINRIFDKITKKIKEMKE